MRNCWEKSLELQDGVASSLPDSVMARQAPPFPAASLKYKVPVSSPKTGARGRTAWLILSAAAQQHSSGTFPCYPLPRQ